MHQLILRGGRLFSPGDGIDYVGDIAIKDGKIVDIGVD